uniref:IQ domain-containing protein E-like n=1 Tax=Phallusia mammillata TaxID=59560 RepID=A0A6F9DFT2_9ASCI|nr:IQ domain-containing protein E-like [Phallusia mammillata]
MPSEAKRPSSPYASSQSPRIPSKAKVWRSLSGSGRQHTTNPQIEKSRENWLRSLRQGSVEPRHHSRDETFKRKTTEEYWISTFRSNGSAETTNGRSPMKGVHGLGGGTSPANLALTSSSEYLREQLGVSTRTSQHKRSASFGGGSQPGTPRYKSQEEMYDEILQLKKTITAQKSEFDMMKSKLRRLEEENSRKDKCIDQLIDQITVMSEGGKGKKGPANDNKLVINTLRQQKIKLEHTVQEKDTELQASKERIKNLRNRARQAKASYVQEVMQLQDALKQYGDDTSFNSLEAEEIPDSARKVKTLRQSVVKLTGENNRLQDENRSLKKDLDRALDGSEHSGDDDDEKDEKIKYSALSRSELVAIIKKSKKKEASKVQENREQNREDQLRLKKVIQNLKEDISQLRIEKNHQTLEIERLQDSNEKLKEDKMDLLQHAQQQPQQTRTSDSRRRRRDSARKQLESSEIQRKQMQIRQRVAAKSIQRQWRKHKHENDEATDEAINIIQSSCRGHVARQEMLHESRPNRQNGRISKSNSRSTLVATDTSDIEEDISYNEDYVSNDDDASVDVIQAAMRGHVARSEVLKSSHSSRPSTAGVRSNYSSHWDDL